MRFACLLVEHLPTRVEALLNPAAARRPSVVISAWGGHVLDASPEAAAAGLGPGDSQRRVEQLCPEAIILPARESLYQSYHDALHAILKNFAQAIEIVGAPNRWGGSSIAKHPCGTAAPTGCYPSTLARQVEIWALGEFFIEISALARTFPSEKVLLLQLAAQAQAATRLEPALGSAANKFTAAQAARQAAGESSRVLVVPDGQERAFLSSLPLTALPQPPAEMLRRLHLFGITTLGGFARLPHAAVVRQFGADLAFFHDLARGLDPRPLAPQSPPPTVSRTLTLPDPLADRRLLLAALERLAARLARALDRSGHHAAALSLIALTADGRERTAGAPVKPPSADEQRLARLAGRLLGRLALDTAVTGLMLTAYPLREWHLGARQLTMLDPPANPALTRLRQTLQLLQGRFGEAIIRLASAIGPPLPLPIQVRAQPDGAPLWLRWGGWSRRVEKVYEYWRESKGWWERPVRREYFQVEASGELVFTLFRDEVGRWFLSRRVN